MPTFDVNKSPEGADELSSLLDDYKKLDEDLIVELGKMGLSAVPLQPKLDEGLVEFTGEGEPILPSDITKLNNRQIGEIASVFNHYLTYIIGQVALADVRLVQWTEMKDLLWSALRVQTDGKKDDKDDAVKLDKRFIKINAEFLNQKNIYTLLRSKESAFNKFTRVISRDLTRRGIEAESNRSGQRDKPVGKYF